eukprot:14633241-Alexandrium_andersonii.AAC.1
MFSRRVRAAAVRVAVPYGLSNRLSGCPGAASPAVVSRRLAACRCNRNAIIGLPCSVLEVPLPCV